MKLRTNTLLSGNVLICVLGAILIVSFIGATVLSSLSTRLNTSVSQVRGWKDALAAAEAAGDLAFAEIRKTSPGLSPTPSPAAWTGWSLSGTTYTSQVITLNNVIAQTVVDKCYFNPLTGPTPGFQLGQSSSRQTCYRVRSRAIAFLPGLKRSGIDDAMIDDVSKHFAAFGSTEMQDITARGKGDSLLRKINFNTDHFEATYGPWPLGDGSDKKIGYYDAAFVWHDGSNPGAPYISRQIEQIVAPLTPFFDAAIQAAGTFYGLGSASYIDSYDSRNGPYNSAIKDSPSSPYYSDSRHGNIEIGSATATVKGSIYGDVATDGGTVTNGNPGNIYGTIDNNVPMTLNAFSVDRSNWGNSLPSGTGPGQLPDNVTTTKTLYLPSAGTKDAPVYYQVSSISGALTVNPAVDASGNVLDSYVTIYVGNGGDFSGGSAGLTLNPQVHAKIYVEGDINVKANSIVNLSANTPTYPNSGPYAGNLQFYSISPTTSNRSQTITLGSGGGQPLLAATFYAPSADFTFQGAPDFIGAVVAKSFYANGNITWHYDRALNDEGDLVDYKIASYVEDPR